jgi:hypothetical protein
LSLAGIRGFGRFRNLCPASGIEGNTAYQPGIVCAEQAGLVAAFRWLCWCGLVCLGCLRLLYPFFASEDIDQALRYAPAAIDDGRVTVDRAAYCIGLIGRRQLGQ